LLVQMSAIDHLVIAGGDLALLSAWFARESGVEPVAGGAHPGMGTRNALVSLGERCYLELIAPDPDQPEPGRPRPFGVDDLAPGSHHLATFALAVGDLDEAVGRLAGIPVDLGRVLVMSRTRPDGVELAWRMTESVHPDHGGALPFLIEWGDTPHPSAGAPAGCAIESLSVRHPEPDRVKPAFEALGFEVPVVRGSPAGISVRLGTPRGGLELGW
jgi:hypothetical protein